MIRTKQQFDQTIPYERIEYIEGTGTQWLNTLIPQVHDMAVEMYVSNVKAGDSMLFGEDWHENGCFCQLPPTTSGSLNMFLCKKQVKVKDSFFNSVQPKYVYVSKDSFKIDDFDKVESELGNTVEDRLYPICFWHATMSTWGSYYGKFRLHSAKIWIYNSLKFDAVPVLDDEGNGCMYDFVSGKLFNNAGTGKFVIGKKQ